MRPWYSGAIRHQRPFRLFTKPMHIKRIIARPCFCRAIDNPGHVTLPDQFKQARMGGGPDAVVAVVLAHIRLNFIDSY